MRGLTSPKAVSAATCTFFLQCKKLAFAQEGAKEPGASIFPIQQGAEELQGVPQPLTRKNKSFLHGEERL